MSLFAIDSGEEKLYTPAAPQGVEAKIFEKEQLAISKWQLAGKPKNRACDPLPTEQRK